MKVLETLVSLWLQVVWVVLVLVGECSGGPLAELLPSGDILLEFWFRHTVVNGRKIVSKSTSSVQRGLF